MKIEHDPKKQEFYIDLGPYRAILMYAGKDEVLDFYHIYVPDPYRRRGISGKILVHAFEYAKKEGYKVVPTCPFIAGDFLKRFPQYQDIICPGEFLFAHGKKSRLPGKIRSRNPKDDE